MTLDSTTFVGAAAAPPRSFMSGARVAERPGRRISVRADADADSSASTKNLLILFVRQTGPRTQSLCGTAYGRFLPVKRLVDEGSLPVCAVLALLVPFACYCSTGVCLFGFSFRAWLPPMRASCVALRLGSWLFHSLSLTCACVLRWLSR